VLAARLLCGLVALGSAQPITHKENKQWPALSLSARTAANQSNQSNKNKIILFFFVDD